MRHSVVLAAVFALLAPLARADTLVLKDGSVREGKILGETEEAYEIEIARGRLSAVIRVPKSDVAAVKRGESENDKLLAEYERRKDALREEDAAGWAELGGWCARQVGLSREAREAFRRAIQTDPDHELARRELGFVRVGDAWLTQDEIMRAKGYVRRAGRWVTPGEARRLAEIAPPGAAEVERSAGEAERDAQVRRALAEREAWLRAGAERPEGVILPPTPYTSGGYLDSTGPYRLHPYGTYPYYAYPYVTGTYVSPGVWVGRVGTYGPYYPYSRAYSTRRSSGVGFGVRWRDSHGNTSWDLGWGTNFMGGGGTFGRWTIRYEDD